MLKPGIDFEYDLYLRVVAMTAEEAKAFFGATENPVDLGPAQGDRWKEGARTWGFPSRAETAEEKARRVWTVANGGAVR